jgi:predicted transglutaminase-like cysteine proteinase
MSSGSMSAICKLAIPVGLVLGLLNGTSYAASSMQTGKLTSQPIGHFEFCKINVDECRIQSIGVQPLIGGAKTMQLIATVDAQVNAAIQPETDLEIYGKDEVWAYPKTAGDCEDYVLLKRKILMNKGISPANLLITVVRKRDGEGHAVLTVRTQHGDYILDNLTDDVLAWEAPIIRAHRSLGRY